LINVKRKFEVEVLK